MAFLVRTPNDLVFGTYKEKNALNREQSLKRSNRQKSHHALRLREKLEAR
jgi:hypothetical protein